MTSIRTSLSGRVGDGWLEDVRVLSGVRERGGDGLNLSVKPQGIRKNVLKTADTLTLNQLNKISFLVASQDLLSEPRAVGNGSCAMRVNHHFLVPIKPDRSQIVNYSTQNNFGCNARLLTNQSENTSVGVLQLHQGSCRQ